jgi:hypothetical protein
MTNAPIDLIIFIPFPESWPVSLRLRQGIQSAMRESHFGLRDMQPGYWPILCRHAKCALGYKNKV